MKRLINLAEQGNSEAQLNLGLMYYRGDRIGQDYTQALKWFEKAANQGSASAQYSLGLMYSNGEGVSRSTRKAREWFGLACDNGSQDGCNKYKYLK